MVHFAHNHFSQYSVKSGGSMAIKCIRDRNTACVTFEGDVDMVSMNDLREALFSLHREGCDICFDMSNVTYLDSSGLGMLLLLKKRQNESGKSFRITNLPETLRRILSAGTLEALFS